MYVQAANEEVIKALESNLEKAIARAQDLEDVLEREKAAAKKLKQDLEKEHHGEMERLREEKDDMMRQAADEWAKERQVYKLS